MIKDIFLSCLLISVFCMTGLPVLLLVNKAKNQDLSFSHLVISGSFGMSLVLVVAANALRIGLSWISTLWVIFGIWLFLVFLISKNRRLMSGFISLPQVKSILKPLGFLNFLVGISAFLLTFSKPNGALIGLRLGVDFALYTDAAQLLIERPSIALSELVESSSTSFGPAAFATHFRWGAPILVAFGESITLQSHSYQILTPVLATCVGLLAAITTVLAKTSGLNQAVAILGGFLIVINGQIITMALEGHLAQVIFLPLFLSVILCWRDFQGLPFRHRTLFSIGVALLLASCTLVYSEFLPIVLLLLFTITIMEVIRVGWPAAIFTLLTFGLTLVCAVLFILPYNIILLPHLLNLKLNGVGYPIPHLILPSEVVGLGSVWTSWTEWMTPAAMPKMLSRANLNYDIFIAFSITGFLVAGAVVLFRKCSEWRFWAASGAVISVMFFQTVLLNRNSYLWLKSVTSFTPLILITLLLGICSINIWRGAFARGLLAILTVAVGVTAIRGISSFRESSRPLFEDVFEVRDYLNSGQSCALLLRPRGLTPSNENQSKLWPGSQKRNVDRVHDFALISIFRENPILDSWTGEPIASQNHGLVSDLPVCIVFEVRKGSYSSEQISKRYSDIFVKERWIVASTGISVLDLRNKGIDSFYSELFELIAP